MCLAQYLFIILINNIVQNKNFVFNDTKNYETEKNVKQKYHITYIIENWAYSPRKFEWFIFITALRIQIDQDK